jgi:hypothetical protein
MERELPEVAARAFSGDITGQAVGVIDDRFKGAGNARFPPLDPDYAAWKRGRRDAMEHLQRFTGRVVSRRIGGNQPILIRTGFLRERINSKSGHRITTTGDTASVIFAALPEYARWLHEETPKMPRRSPVEPNGADRERVLAYLRRWLQAQTGRGGAVSIA